MNAFEIKLGDYDVEAVDRSPVKFADAVQSVADILLKNLNRFENANADIIGKFFQLSLKLKTKNVDSPNLTEGENLLLYNRQQRLAQQIELGINDAREQLLSLKSQAEDISARLDRINHLPNSLSELATLEREPRPSFAFLVENAVRIINNSQRRVDFFIANQQFVENIIDRWADWNEDYEAFKTVKRKDFIARCSAAQIEQEIWQEWYADWQSKRFAIEQRFLPLVEFALKGNLLSTDGTESAAEQTLSILETYKYDVDDFFILKRKNIRQAPAVKNELQNLTDKFQRSLQNLIGERTEPKERIFLSHWAEPLALKANFS